MTKLLNYIRIIILVLTVPALLGGCDKHPHDKPSWVQDILDHYKDSIPSYGIVALADNGKTFDTASIGVSFDKNSINTKNRFCIGSCTKMYTATLILKLQEQGMLNINDSIYHFFQGHKFIDSTITIKQLLNHTSGLTDFTKNGFINIPILNPYGDYSDNLIFSRIDTIEFEKGIQYKYCNTNYFLLRKIIEIVSDKPYESILQEYIITPLGLKNTFPYYSNRIESLAHPIIDGQDLDKIPKLGSNTISRGIGNIVSDIYDVNTFIRALLLNKTILKPATLKQMSSFFSYKKSKIGLGLFEEIHGDQAVWGHTGRQVSYVSYAFINPKTGQSFVVLANNANDEYADKIIGRLCERKQEGGKQSKKLHK